LEPKIAAGVVLLWKGELVLGKRGIEPGYGRLIFPGGFVDRGETPKDAACREALEEMGVTVAELQLINVYSYPGHPVILVAYTGEIVGGTPHAADETLSVASFPLDRIPYDQLAFRSTADAVRDFMAWRSRRS
jgi:8-oxo-dGTP diphosphatase